MLSLSEAKKLRKLMPDSLLRNSGSIGYDQDYGGSNRDTLAESFVTSFLGVQGEVSRTVQKGLTVSFELDAYIRQCQVKIDGVLDHLREEQNSEAKEKLVVSLNEQFDEMCAAQIRANQKWNELEDQISTTVTETESHWKRAEPFFRSKQKRNDATGASKTKNDARSKTTTRKLLSSIPFHVQPSGPSQARPSLLPKRPLMQGVVRKKVNSDARKQDKQSTEMTRSVTPDRQRSDRKIKSNGLLGVRKGDKKEKDARGDLKEKKMPTSPVKKKRMARPSIRPVKRTLRAQSDESFTESESSGTPYGSNLDKRMRKNFTSDSDKESSAPDEIRYCSCHGISYGHMVGCDYDGCTIEWYHFTCVGLKAKPRGKWYCPECRDGDNCKVLKFPIGEKADEIQSGGKTAS